VDTRKPGGLTRGVAISAVGNLFPPVAGLVSVPLLANGLGVFGRGEVAAATAPLILAASGLTLGIPEAMTYAISRRRSDLRYYLVRGLVVLLLVGAAGTGAIATLAPRLSDGNADLERLIVLSALCLVPALLGIGVRGAALALNQWHMVSADRIVTSVLRLLALGFLYSTGSLTVQSAVAVIAGATFVGALVYVPLFWHRPSYADVSGRIPSLIGYGLAFWVGSVAGTLLARLDQVIMVPLAGEAELGIYAVAVSLAELVFVFNNAVRDVMLAVEASSPSDARVAAASRISTAFTIVIAVLIAIAAWIALPWIFGDEFSGVLPAALILLLGAVLGNPGSAVSAAASARGHPLLRSGAIATGLAVNVAAMVMLVPPHGALGASIATALGSVVAGFTSLVLMKRLTGMPLRSFLGVRRSDLTYLRTTIGERLTRRSIRAQRN